MGTERQVAHDTRSLEEGRERLRQLIWFDVMTAVAAETVIGATYVFVVRSGWLPVLGVMVGCSGAIMAVGLRPLSRGDLGGAVRWLAAANWSIALAVSVIATFAWPLMMLAALLPAVLAAPYVPVRRLRWYLVISLAVTLSVAALGLLQDVTGFEDQLPRWVPPAIVIVFTSFLAWMVVQIALQNSTRLQAALNQTLAANAQLRRSEQILAEQARSLQASRVRLVAATDQERRRVERDLHDGAQQRLVALGVGLRLAQDLCRTDAVQAADAIAAVRDEIHAAQNELRDLAHGVYPPVLTQHGLAEALRAAADRCPLPVDVQADGRARFDPAVEAAVYFCCAEALQNAAKHAGANTRVTVTIAHDGDRLHFSVVDDGVGFDAGHDTAGTGFENLRERLGAADGQLVVESTPGQGTTVAGSLPAASRTPRPRRDPTTHLGDPRSAHSPATR
jgi:signal transduction histidine kinase